jgi:hypothetical protein
MNVAARIENEIIPQLMAKPRDDLQKDRTRFLSGLPFRSSSNATAGGTC